jgi:hypothetical protein
MSVEWIDNKLTKPLICRMYLGWFRNDYEFLYWSDGWSVYQNNEWVKVQDDAVEHWAPLNRPAK